MRRPLNASWCLAIADRTNGAVRYGDTVGGGQTAEAVTLHAARVALTHGRAGDIDLLADLEQVDLQFGASLEVRLVGRSQAELHERLARGHIGLGEVARNSLGIELWAAGTVRDLHSTIAVFFLCLHLRDAVRENLDHGARYRFTRIREHARHASLTADESDCHYCLIMRLQPASEGGDDRRIMGAGLH